MKDLRQHMEISLNLPPLAVKWLIDLWDAIQFLDDVVDGAETPLNEKHRMVFTLIAGLPSNPFFMAHCQQLLPVLATAVLKWRASDDAERAGDVDARSFVWRAGYYDVVLHVVLLCHGPEAASTASKYVMHMYGETVEKYLKEFENA